MTKLPSYSKMTTEASSVVVANGKSGIIRQGDFFPLRTIFELPDCVSGAEAWGQVRGSDTHDYIVKTTSAGPHVPACEFITTQLAETLNLACPTCKIIELQDGQLAFGSRIISGISDKIRTTQILTGSSIFDGTTAKGLTSYLSEVFAFDMFTCNIDRHDHNFISIDDNGRIRFYIVDFARALLWNDDPSKIPLPQHPTRSYGRIFRSLHGFDLDSAIGMLNKLGELSVEKIHSIVRLVPDDWLAQPEKDRFVELWWGKNRLQKLEKLRKGFEDGSLL